MIFKMVSTFFKNKLSFITYLFTCILYITYVLLFYLLKDDSIISNAFSSDALYLPTFYIDIFIDKTGIEGLKLNAAPNFFPDMFLYFILYSITGNVVISGIVYSVIQSMFILVLFFLISKVIFYKSFNFIYPAFINILFILILISGLFNSYISLTWHLINNAYHTSAFVLSLFSIYLYLKYIRFNKTIHIILLSVCIFLGSLNDKIYILAAVFPLAILSIILLFKKIIQKQKTFKLLLSISISAILGLTALNIILNITSISLIHKDFTFSLEKTLYSINFAWGYLSEQLLKFDIVSLILVSGYMTYIILIIKLLFFRNNFSNEEATYKTIFQFFSVLFFFFVFLTPIIIIGEFHEPSMFRYIIFIFYLAFINIGLLFSHIKHRLPINIITFSLLFFTLFVLGNQFSKNDLKYETNALINFKPEYIKNIEEIATNEKNLKLGIASYWKARQITAFNNKDLRVYATFKNNKLNPELFCGSNRLWFFPKSNEPNDRIYNFIVLDELKDTSFYYDYFEKNELLLYEHKGTYILKVVDFYFLNNQQKIQKLDSI
jgi:hypothetical protein